MLVQLNLLFRLGFRALDRKPGPNITRQLHNCTQLEIPDVDAKFDVSINLFIVSYIFVDLVPKQSLEKEVQTSNIN